MAKYYYDDADIEKIKKEAQKELLEELQGESDLRGCGSETDDLLEEFRLKL